MFGHILVNPGVRITLRAIRDGRRNSIDFFPLIAYMNAIRHHQNNRNNKQDNKYTYKHVEQGCHFTLLLCSFVIYTQEHEITRIFVTQPCAPDYDATMLYLTLSTTCYNGVSIVLLLL